MRVSLLVPYRISPPDFGGARRIHGILRAAAGCSDLQVLIVGDGDPRAGLDGVRCSAAAVHPAKSSAASRGLARLRAFWGGAHPATSLLYGGTRLREVLDHLRAHRPDVLLLVHSFAYHPDLRAAAPHVVIDEYNLDFVDGAGRGLLRGRRVRSARAAAEEAYSRASEVWVVSPEDRERVAGLAGGAAVRLLPLTLDPAGYAGASEGEPYRVCFTGAFWHPPNAQAARFLVREVWPRLLREEPRARLLLAGASSGTEMRDLCRRVEGVELQENVPSMAAVILRSSVAVVPVFEGTGMRTKLLEAWAAGRPVVSTRRGAEGVMHFPDPPVLLAESPEEFVRAILSTWRDADATAARVRRGLELVRTEFSDDRLRARVEESLRTVAGGA